MANKHSINARAMAESFFAIVIIFPEEFIPTLRGRGIGLSPNFQRVFPISVPLYMGGVLEKDPAPHLTARQEQAVQRWGLLDNIRR
ncbi:hypothetical protein Tco_1253296 [Tanacetum coccineum]